MRLVTTIIIAMMNANWMTEEPAMIKRTVPSTPDMKKTATVPRACKKSVAQSTGTANPIANVAAIPWNSHPRARRKRSMVTTVNHAPTT